MIITRRTKTANQKISGGIGERKNGMLRPVEVEVEGWIDRDEE